MINSEEFLEFQAKQEQSATQHVKLYMHYLKCDSCAGDMAYNREQASSAELQAKLDSITRLYRLAAVRFPNLPNPVQTRFGPGVQGSGSAEYLNLNLLAGSGSSKG